MVRDFFQLQASLHRACVRIFYPTLIIFLPLKPVPQPQQLLRPPLRPCPISPQFHETPLIFEDLSLTENFLFSSDHTCDGCFSVYLGFSKFSLALDAFCENKKFMCPSFTQFIIRKVSSEGQVYVFKFMRPQNI